jgi:hypothetical protein
MASNTRHDHDYVVGLLSDVPDNPDAGKVLLERAMDQVAKLTRDGKDPRFVAQLLHAELKIRGLLILPSKWSHLFSI